MSLKLLKPFNTKSKAVLKLQNCKHEAFTAQLFGSELTKKQHLSGAFDSCVKTRFFNQKNLEIIKAVLYLIHPPLCDIKLMYLRS